VLMARVNRVIAPIELQGRTTSFSPDIQLLAVDENGEPVPGIKLTPDHVKANVQIESRVEVQRASVLPRFTGQPAPGYTTERIDWTPKFVEIIASQAITVPLETEPIDLTGRTESFTQTVRVINPEGVRARLLNERVTVSVPVVPFQIPSNVPLFVPVSPTKLGPDLQVTAEPPSLTITVSGTFDQLSQLATATVQATVDLSGLGPGTYQLPAEIQLPPGLLIGGEPPQVTVTITPKSPGEGTPAPTTEGG
jgi:YbbR domain-containing protein